MTSDDKAGTALCIEYMRAKVPLFELHRLREFRALEMLESKVQPRVSHERSGCTNH